MKGFGMDGIVGRLKTGILLFFLVLGAALCPAGPRLDKSKYISIDEIQPGMEAYCLTTYKGTEVEKFGLKVLDVVRNISPGRDAIMVQGTDERLIHSGPVAGFSGSPVYIQGRLAGALSFGWSYSKDPLYGVTPIEEMLEVGQIDCRQESATQMGFTLDFTRAIDFARINKQLEAGLAAGSSGGPGATALPCPLVTSGLPAAVVEKLNRQVQPFGLMAVAGIGGSDNSQSDSSQLAPGASLVVPLVTGDITMAAVGTVTEVDGDKIYCFGHSLLGYGSIDLPMATGKVHTVVSNVVRSFKLASPVEIVGALRVDQAAAVLGQIGAKARMIPLEIRVDRYNDAVRKVYNCKVADNRLFTPMVLGPAVAGAALNMGDLPPDHMIEYKVDIGLSGLNPITFENISTSLGLNEITTEIVGSVIILLNNPYKKVAIESIDIDIRIAARNVISHIWSVNLSDSRVKAGDNIDVSVIVESFLAGKKEYRYSLKIPDDLAPGQYDLILCGSGDYYKFLRKAAPYKFTPQNFTTLVEAMNNILSIKRNRLYHLFALPPAGIAVEKALLPELPATKAMVLGDAKRTLEIQPYQNWIEKSLETDTVVIDEKVLKITVEQ